MRNASTPYPACPKEHYRKDNAQVQTVAIVSKQGVDLILAPSRLNAHSWWLRICKEKGDTF